MSLIAKSFFKNGCRKMPDELPASLVRVAEAAERIGVHRATARDFILAQRLKGYRKGSRWYVCTTDIEEFVRTYERPKNRLRHQGTEATADYWINLILSWLIKRHAATAKELNRVIDLHVGNLRKYLKQAAESGLVERNGSGVWSLTAEGKHRANLLPKTVDPVTKK